MSGLPLPLPVQTPGFIHVYYTDKLNKSRHGSERGEEREPRRPVDLAAAVSESLRGGMGGTPRRGKEWREGGKPQLEEGRAEWSGGKL